MGTGIQRVNPGEVRGEPRWMYGGGGPESEHLDTLGVDYGWESRVLIQGSQEWI